jgi:hypothetical protein
MTLKQETSNQTPNGASSFGSFKVGNVEGTEAVIELSKRLYKMSEKD